MTKIKLLTKMKLAAKINFITVFSVSVILIVAFLYLVTKERNKDISYAYSNSEAIAMQSASEIKSEMEVSLDGARSLAQALSAYESFPEENRREISSAIIRKYVEENKGFLGAWVCFLPNALDGADAHYVNAEGHDGTGRFIPSWSRNNDKIVLSPLTDYDVEGAGDYFLQAYHSGRETVLEPYKYDFNGEKVLLTTFSVPVKNNAGKIVGVAGVDISLASLNEMVFSTGDYNTAQLYLLSNNGAIVIHSNKDFVGKTLQEVETETEKTAAMMSSIQNGEIYVTDGVSAMTGESTLKTLVPIALGSIETPWSMGFSVQMSEVTAASRNNAVILVVLFLLLVGAVTFAVGFSVRKIINKPLKELVTVADEQAAGNYNLEIHTDREDELGLLFRAFKTMNDQMNDLLSNLKIASAQVAAGSRQISDSSVELSQGATEQASSIEQLTASTEEISSQTHLNAENADEANALALHTKSYAENGNQEMQRLLGAMEEIDVSSNNISRIIKVIDDIAFQTNILALNAAVEAARAGQQGKGFAVVAEEVRNLAARSAAAAKETTALIEESIHKASEGGKTAGKTAETLHSIVVEVTRLAELMHNISVASNEQAAGIAQINEGILQVSHVVQANSALAQESAAASEELSGQAEALQEQASHFNLRADRKDDMDFPAVADGQNSAL